MTIRTAGNGFDARTKEATMVGRMIKRWAVVAIAVPLAAAGARKLSSVVESRRGPSRTSNLLRRAGDTLHQKKKGRRAWR
ncbi:hypothetical protein [Micromonospora sp. LOL_023]|uniref:hypothetical protein n=1 Tax=Micromonospora sp. LOL_023 TaxID=3345418 RepID=UPI003A86B675